MADLARARNADICVPSLVVFGLWALEHQSTAVVYCDGELASLKVRPCERFNFLGVRSGEPCKAAVFAPSNLDTVAIMQVSVITL